jgi:ligand-binding sensor domain-containing protein/signal transduction histidine kinase
MNPLEKWRADSAPKAKRLHLLWRRVFFLLLVLFAESSVWAVDPSRHISQYAHTAWRVQDGVFSGTPNAITQTQDGYLWIGTAAGLLHFDGVRFVPATTGDGQPLPDVRINFLLSARDGSLWIGTRAGLSQLKDGKLLNYSIAPIGISNIIQDHEGTIWVTRYRVTDGKGPLCRVVGKELRCYGKADGIPVEYGVPLVEDSLGNLWIGSYVICRWKPGSSTIYFAKELKHLKGNPGVLDLVAGPSGSVWVALEVAGPGLGVRHFSGEKWTSYVVPGFDSASVKAHCLFLDPNNTLWIGTETEGIYRIRDGTVDHYRSIDGLSGDAVNGIYQDREGNLWVTTDQGVDLFRDTPVVSFSTREGLSAANTRSVLARRDGSVWVGNGGDLDVLFKGHVSVIGKRQGLPGEEVTALFEDHAGRLWLGTDQKVLTYERGRFFEVTQADGRALGAPERSCTAVTEDSDHNIWVMMYGFGRGQLFRIENHRVREEIPLPGIPKASWLAPDQETGIWIGSNSDVLARYRGGHMETISLGRGDKSFTTQSLVVDSRNSIWVATSNGLVRWNDGIWKTLDARNGLPCSSIIALIKDNQGALWLRTQCGILNITESELEHWWQRPDSKVAIRTFNALDGAQPGIPQPAQPSSSMSLDGRLWFVNDTLLQMIDPSQLKVNPTLPQVHIEQVVANRRSYLPRKVLRLPSLIRDLEIDYTALSLAVPQRVHFRYKLEGHDAGWQEPGTRRQAFYSDLRPGRYRFQVIACNNDGVWNEMGATLDFSVAPAWYQTNWFRILCVVSCISIAWFIYRQRVLQISRAIGTRFDERLAERTRMARDLHDTFLQTIQGSKLVADDALEPSADPIRMRRALEQLSVWLERATQEGRTALNSLRTATTQKNDLGEALLRMIQDSAIPSSTAVTLSVLGDSREMHPLVRDEIYRIGYEAIHNACAHSGASRLEVELRYANDLVLRVSDNGTGIDPAIADRGKDGHFGLQGMRERAARIAAKLVLLSSANSGTEVKLTVPGGIVFGTNKPIRRSLFSRVKALFRSRHKASRLD